MTLELNKIGAQIDDVGRKLASRVEHVEQVLPALRALRQAFSGDLERLRMLAASPEGEDPRCSVPTGERLDATFSAPPAPARATIVAADGSQIYPDAHGWALYYLINVGSLVYLHGSREAPRAETEPLIGDAVDDAGNLLTGEQVSARRDVAEIRKLAEKAGQISGAGPVSYTHLRAHETNESISYAVFCLK